MDRIRQLNDDGSSTIYRSMTVAAQALGVGVQAISYAVHFGYRVKGHRMYFLDKDPETKHRDRRTGKQKELDHYLDALAPLAGRKQDELRAYVYRHAKNATKQAVHEAIGWWYIHLPYNDGIYIDVSEYLRRLNAL